MLKITSIILCFVLFAIVAIGGISTKNNNANGEEKKIYHLFTHALIAHENIAFDKDNEMKEHLKRDCVTVCEFKKGLQALYKNDFILVNPEDLYQQINGKISIVYPKIPKGKKPLLLSFDDINYYTKKMNSGMNDKIIISDGKLATYTKLAENKISFDNEVIIILENFVKKYPDFSYNNAKGIICLTGFDGILGYRTNRDSENSAEEIERIKPVVEKLKKNNWKFACHSYGHYHMKRLSTEKFVSDTKKWVEEVSSIIGKTNIYCYPYGEWEISTNEERNAKHDYLLNNGFNFFLSVGDTNFFVTKNKGEFIFMDRTPFDGNVLKNKSELLTPFFEGAKILDENKLR